MLFAIDEVIPYWQEAFAPLGEIRTFSGRKISRSEVREADALIVRSVTRVDAGLLEGSAVRFVGSTTIGLDHLDQEYLRSRGIFFTNAAGSNANSVAEYIVAALLVVAQRRGWKLHEKCLGIIGAGRVGEAVERKARALRMSVLLCDPPLRESTGDPRYLFLEDVLSSDILTLHVPLTLSGSYPTWQMMRREVLECLSSSQFLINSARGSVVGEVDLKTAIEKKKIGGAVLDVWEGEPSIDYDLLRLLELGTPHIAGYSFDGKVRATEMILESLCDYFEIENSWDSRGLFPAPVHLQPTAGTSGQDAVCSVVLQAYDILRDDANLRALRGLPKDSAIQSFDRLRNEYRRRPEFRHFLVDMPSDQREIAVPLETLGFQISFREPDRAVYNVGFSRLEQ